MSVFGILTPTLFYQIYGNVRPFLSAISPLIIAFKLRSRQSQLVCEGCPVSGPHTPSTLKPKHGAPWVASGATTTPALTRSQTYFIRNRFNGLMFFCAGVLVLVSPSLLSSTRFSMSIKVLITSFPLSIVLLNGPQAQALPPHAWPRRSGLAEPPSTDGTQGPHRVHGHLPQPFEYATCRRAAEKAECGDYDPTACSIHLQLLLRVCPPRPTRHRPQTSTSRRHISRSRAALTNRGQASFALAADRDHAPRRAIQAYRQSLAANSAAGDTPWTILHARWPPRPSRRYDTRARRRACPPPVLE